MPFHRGGRFPKDALLSLNRYVADVTNRIMLLSYHRPATIPLPHWSMNVSMGSQRDDIFTHVKRIVQSRPF
jgi:hypothetical protein